METVELKNEVSFQESTYRGNRINNVVLLGAISKNGYSYSIGGMKRAVDAGLFEGKPLMIGHADSAEQRSGRRDPFKLAGKFTNTRFDETQGKVRADAVLLDTEGGKLIRSIAETMPDVGGCSQVARGKMITRNGQRIIEEISAVESVDYVLQPATTAGLHESKNNPSSGTEIVIDKMLAESNLPEHAKTLVFRQALLENGIAKAPALIQDRLDMCELALKLNDAFDEDYRPSGGVRNMGNRKFIGGNNNVDDAFVDDGR